jgi:hypothetical protein
VAGSSLPFHYHCFEEREMMPDVNKIIRYEQNEMDEEEIIEMFQDLINSGMAWRLQGHYGRTAKALIEEGLCTLPSKQGNSGSRMFSA